MEAPTSLTWPIRGRPRVRLAGRFPHVDRGHEITYRGSHHALHLYDYPCDMRLGDREVRIEAGDVTLTPADVPASYHLPRPGTHLCVHFWHMRPRRSSGEVALPLHIRLGGRRDAAAQPMMTIAELHRQSSDDPLAAAAASQMLQALLLCLAAGFRASRSRGPAPGSIHARWAVELLQQDLARPLNVPELAQRIGVSQNYLARRFRQVHGVTIPRYLLRARIEHAHLLLTSTDLPVKAIGARVGFPDPQHFNKQFRRLMGQSPSSARAAS